MQRILNKVKIMNVVNNSVREKYNIDSRYL